MHLLEPLRHELERFAESRFERGMQLLVDRHTHCVELLRIVELKFLEARLERAADLGEALLAVFALFQEALPQQIAETRERLGALLARTPGIILQRLAQGFEALVIAQPALLDALAEILDPLVLLLRELRELGLHGVAQLVEPMGLFEPVGALLLAQRTLEAVTVLAHICQGLAQRSQHIGATASQQEQLQHDQDDEHDECGKDQRFEQRHGRAGGRRRCAV
ncbi:MAG: hypothetical protein AMXMBFR59_00960 [Rhodanobacteraceae bacterium]